MFSKSTNIRYSMFIAIALLFFSSFYLTLIGFDRSILLSQENQEEKNIEQTIIPENLPFDSQIFNSDSSLSGFDVWGQPMRITAENLQRNEYDIYQDETGKYHFVYIKEVTTHGMGLAYSCSTNDSATEWSLEEIIITVEATIIKPKIIVDNDQNIHIGYFSAREDYYRVNYLNKSSSSVNWGAEKILNSTRTHTPLELIFGKTNTTVHMSWIFSEKGKTAQTWNSKIIFLSKLNNASVWTRTENDSFNLINPLRMDFKALTNGTIILLCSVWAEDYLNNTILITRSNDFGVNWNAFNEIYEYNRKIGYVYVQPSIISDNCHIVFVSQNSPRILFYFKVLTNGTVNGTVDQISQQLANSFFAGIVENNQTKNLHLVYEEMQDNRYNIFQRTKLAGNTTWEAATKVTNDDTSLDPIMLQSNIDGSTHFGQLFYLSEYSVFAKSYNSSENWQLDNELLRTSRFEDDPSFVIDSEGTMHLVVEHLIPPYSEIRYYRKEIGESWTFEGSLTETWWTQATSPKIISDSNDNIHCLFIAEEQTFHDDTLYYRTLNKGTNNWSAPLLITTPAEPAVDYHLEFLADVSNTLHIIWIESTGTDRNRMVYSTKSEMATNFTTEDRKSVV